MNRLYFVRHGENPANLTKEFSHRRVDYSLTPKGRLQAQQTAAYFLDKDIHALYSSPLRRAIETADIIANQLGINFQVIEEFREVNVGDLEDLPVSQENWGLYTQVTKDWMLGILTSCFPGGEDYLSLRDRMFTGLLKVVELEMGKNFILVGHGGIFTHTLKDLCPQVDINWLMGQEMPNCSISEILITKKNKNLVGELVSWSSSNHLHGKAAELVSGVPASISG